MPNWTNLKHLPNCQRILSNFSNFLPNLWFTQFYCNLKILIINAFFHQIYIPKKSGLTIKLLVPTRQKIIFLGKKSIITISLTFSKKHTIISRFFSSCIITAKKRELKVWHFAIHQTFFYIFHILKTKISPQTLKPFKFKSNAA